MAGKVDAPAYIRQLLGVDPMPLPSHPSNPFLSHWSALERGFWMSLDFANPAIRDPRSVFAPIGPGHTHSPAAERALAELAKRDVVTDQELIYPLKELGRSLHDWLEDTGPWERSPYMPDVFMRPCAGSVGWPMPVRSAATAAWVTRADTELCTEVA